MVDKSLPEILKYSVALISFGRFHSLSDEPDPKWSRIETMAYEGDINRIFEGFRGILGEVTGMTRFRLGSEDIAVYFDPANKKSLLIVGVDGEEVVEYIKELGLRVPATLIPFSRPSDHYPGRGKHS